MFKLNYLKQNVVNFVVKIFHYQGNLIVQIHEGYPWNFSTLVKHLCHFSEVKGNFVRLSLIGCYCNDEFTSFCHDRVMELVLPHTDFIVKKIENKNKKEQK